ncbi:hypothetical protein [Limoniibacter endophyticus]|uniref:Uncharacterized protein n=1 Tax=Limoniibacter endophyticus TaxID=1565040 RepID=A0A8J3DMN6_9HYPH|nr:hypothetical protein [Limoniibacter endophyticus]GHC71236.1 hypothetical protein GCM10010136_18260 [Limoniibacter endophyticus]
MANQALTREDLQTLFAAPVVPDAANVFEAFTDADDLKRLVDRYERGMTMWRNDTRLKIEKAIASLKEKAAEHAASTYSQAALPLVNDMLHTLERATASLTTPLESEPEHQATFRRLRFGSGAKGKFFRRNLDRAEEIRVLNYDAVLNWRSQLLGLKRDLMRDAADV